VQVYDMLMRLLPDRDNGWKLASHLALVAKILCQNSVTGHVLCARIRLHTGSSQTRQVHVTWCVGMHGAAYDGVASHCAR
jgi:hypothetical protein